jgi:hypothetical protein
MLYLTSFYNNLIVRGGGTGPMKPGNQLAAMVPIPADEFWKMRVE